MPQVKETLREDFWKHDPSLQYIDKNDDCQESASMTKDIFYCLS